MFLKPLAIHVNLPFDENPIVPYGVLYTVADTIACDHKTFIESNTSTIGIVRNSKSRSTLGNIVINKYLRFSKYRQDTNSHIIRIYMVIKFKV